MYNFVFLIKTCKPNEKSTLHFSLINKVMRHSHWNNLYRVLIIYFYSVSGFFYRNLCCHVVYLVITGLPMTACCSYSERDIAKQFLDLFYNMKMGPVGANIHRAIMVWLAAFAPVSLLWHCLHDPPWDPFPSPCC